MVYRPKGKVCRPFSFCGEKGLIMPTIVFGLLSVALGLWGASIWWWSVVEVLRGLVPLVLLVLGLVALGAGVTKMRDGGASPEQPDAELMENSPRAGE
jgi:hypothetical protein